jgi:hypothetical protein
MGDTAYQRSDYRNLLELQRIDAEIGRLRAAIARAKDDPEVAALRARVEEAVRAEEAAREKVAKLRRKAAWEEQEADQRRAQVAEMERKMYGGEVASAKELDQMGKRVEQLKAEADRHEEAGLQAIVELEEAEPLLGEAERAAGEARKLLDAAEAERDKLVAGLEEELGALEPRREEAARRVPSDLLAKYERIRRARGGVGVAALDAASGLCGACLVKVPVRLAESVKSGYLENCESCGRLLVYVGEEQD